LAAVGFEYPHIQVVVVGEDDTAKQLHDAALARYASTKTVIPIKSGEAVPQNMPPALADTIPGLAAANSGKSIALVCSGFACQPPTSDPKELSDRVNELLAPSAQK
jgi:uncharacterized protein YyaL (SSP411 family)